MASTILYSTNTYLKLYIQERFRHDLHYVWCSEHFDVNALPKYASGRNVPASSNPIDVFREIKRDVESQDQHSARINGQKASLNSLAVKWEAAGDITTDEKDEIIYIVNNASFHQWRPLMYVIPRAPVAARMKLVPPHSRAGLSEEYIIEDLKRPEFDIIEF
ncbi:MAG: hypothetical protein JO316_02050 [Abitibacteriaceae bacterium]|nr:hypothetical protein [Abditibacteriaceae bacterium]